MTALDVVAADAGPASAAPARSLRGEAWRRFRRNRMAMVGLGFLVLLVLAAILRR
ncbi:MAG: hypothetical protein R2749_28700 [Acidimicrobiales bacterium]